jgi:DMSO/TMAO reductase YedYZ molybdopterin-dependent catalytic subunit
MKIDRRRFLLSSAGFMVQMQGFKPGLIVRSEGPVDLETPLSTLDKAWLTPIESHYVRCHLPTPKIDDAIVKGWTLTIDGEVNQPLKLTLDDLRRYREVSQVVTLECSGNGRVFANPTVGGLQWEKGAVSTAKWTGVSLRDVLMKAGVKPDGKHIIQNGLDEPLGSVPDFVRSIPIEKALHPDTLLAYKMNDVEIPLIHGRPLRLIVPGWEAAGSCKWLTSMHVSTAEAEGFFMQTAYRVPNRNVAPGSAVDPKDTIAYTALDVKSILTSPADDSTFKLGQPIELRGFAWAGEADVTRVDISTDFGRSWVAAELGPEKAKYAWRRFRYTFKPAKIGSYLPLSRATDSQGRTQPVVPNWNPSGYVYNVVDKVRINVEG